MDDSQLDRVKVERIQITHQGFFVYLRKDGADGEVALLPISTGGAEAQAIAFAFNNAKFPRPMTHDLFRNVLELLDCELARVVITHIVESTFFAKLYLTRGAESFQIDSRPSDAVALALRFKAPIFVAKTVMQSAGITLPHGADDDDEEDGEGLQPAQRLRRDLETAVLEERYEDAARVRDEIKKLQNDN